MADQNQQCGFDAHEKLKSMEKARCRQQALDLGLPQMTVSTLKQLCIDNDGYETPELNDKLYAHYKGFVRIEGLDRYTGLKALWLESNGLRKIENLHMLRELRCLYLHQNLIEKIEGLENLTELVTLDLSQNQLTKVENLSCLPKLNTLNISKNHFYTAESISHLSECPALTNVDLSNNKIEEGDVFEVFSKMHKLTALKFDGNPIIAKIKHFRKTAINKLPQLNYLDRPIFELEKVGALAWGQGGREAELQAREKFKEEERNRHKESMQQFREWQKEVREKKMAEIAARKAASPNAPAQNYFSIDVDGNDRPMAHYLEGKAGQEEESEEWRARRAQAHLDALEEKQLVAGDGRNSLTDEEEKRFDRTREAKAKCRIKKLGQAFWAPQESAMEFQREDTVVDSIEPTLGTTTKPEPTNGGSQGLCNQDPPLTRKETAEDVSALQDLEAPEGSLTASTWELVVEGPAVPNGKADEQERRVKEEEEQRALEERKRQEREEEARKQLVQESLKLHRERKAKAEKEESYSGSPSQRYATGPAVLQNKSEPVKWTQDLDKLLGQTVRNCMFDFENVAKEMRKNGAGPHVSAKDCRLRFASLSDKRENGPVVVWTEAMDKELTALVREHAFEFSKVTEGLKSFISRGLDTKSDPKLSEHIDEKRCRERWAELDFDNLIRGHATKIPAPSKVVTAPVARSWDELAQMAMSNPRRMVPSFIPSIMLHIASHIVVSLVSSFTRPPLATDVDNSLTDESAPEDESDDEKPLKREDIEHSLRGTLGKKLQAKGLATDVENLD